MSITRATAVLAAAVGSLAIGAVAQPIPGTDLEAAELVAELPWTLEVTVEGPATPDNGAGSAARVTRYRFKSTEPYFSTAAGKVYLRVELAASEHSDAAASEAAFEKLFASADPDTGLSYAWDRSS